MTTTQADFLAGFEHGPVIAVSRTLFADSETPMGLYRKFGQGAGSFLLESADHGQGTRLLEPRAGGFSPNEITPRYGYRTI